MGDHVVLCVDRLIAPAEAVGHSMAAVVSESSGVCFDGGEVGDVVVVGRKEEEEEEEPLIGAAECRICQEDDSVKNMDSPCSCSGSLKYAHKTCLQQWVNAKGDLTCEICHEPYKTGHYVLPPAYPDEATIDFSGGWTISDAHLDLHDRLFFSAATAQHHFLEAEYDDHDTVDATGTAFCRSVALILMALLLIRHAFSVYDGDGSEEAADILSIFLLRGAGLLLSCYAMAWFINSILQRRRREERAALASSEVAFMLGTAQPRSPTNPRQDPE